MKMTLEQMLNSGPGIQEIASAPIPAATSFRLAKMMREFNGYAEDYEKTRQELIARMTAKVKEEEDIDISPSALYQRKDFQVEIGALLSEEVELEAKKIDIRLLGDAPITPRSFVNLDWLISDNGSG